MDMDVDVSSPEVMMAFYKRLYPFKSIFNWLNHQHAPSRQFTHREFAFTLQGDVYIRYNSFATADELKQQVVRLNPSRFEIGAVYNARVSDDGCFPIIASLILFSREIRRLYAQALCSLSFASLYLI